MWVAWIAGLGTGVSITVLVNDWRAEQHRRALEDARRVVWAEPLRLFTHRL